MAINMGIGNIGLSSNLFFKRKFRWTFFVYNIGGVPAKVIPVDYVKVANRPNVSFEETEINYLHGKMYIPGKATFDAVTVTYYDISQKNGQTIEALYDWIGSVYDFLGPAGPVRNPKMSGVASGIGGYAAESLLTMFDGCGSELERWYLNSCWPQAVNFGDLDYSNNEEATIEVTIRYMFAKWENKCGRQPAPSCVGCG
jgi:hypothetical protein